MDLILSVMYSGQEYVCNDLLNQGPSTVWHCVLDKIPLPALEIVKFQ